MDDKFEFDSGTKQTHSTSHSHDKEAKQIKHDIKDGVPDNYQIPVSEAGDVAREMTEKCGMKLQDSNPTMDKVNTPLTPNVAQAQSQSQGR